jgi:RNA polymerase sigma-70 factor (ECF subfamily)
MTDRDLASGAPLGTRDDDAHPIELSLADPDCFGALFDRYFAEIHGYAARRIGRDAVGRAANWAGLVSDPL